MDLNCPRFNNLFIYSLCSKFIPLLVLDLDPQGKLCSNGLEGYYCNFHFHKFDIINILYTVRPKIVKFLTSLANL